MTWLPEEFKGIRSCEEARRDLLAIVRDPDRTSLIVDPDDGEEVVATGSVTGREGPSGSVQVSIDGAPAFEFEPARFRGAWLFTYDGADYYSLSIDLGWGRVFLGDA